MRRLLPPPGPAAGEVDLHEVYAWPRRCVRGLMVASLDGAAEVGGSSDLLSGPADRRVLVHLRATCDVVLAGAGTVRAEGWHPPRLSAERRAWRLRHGLTEVPAYAVVTRSGRLPPGDAAGAALAVGGSPDEVLDELAGRGLHRVLCEGGPSWLGAVASAGRLDELCLTTSPQLAGPGRLRLLEGQPWPASRPVRLLGLLEEDGWLFARYGVGAPSTSPPAS